MKLMMNGALTLNPEANVEILEAGRVAHLRRDGRRAPEPRRHFADPLA